MNKTQMEMRLRTFILKKSSLLISFILTCLGFGATLGLNGCEYGSPTATFKVKGNIKSEKTLNPIPQIRVIMDYDTVYSDAEGNYQTHRSGLPEDVNFVFKFEDVDGEANGKFQTLDTIIEFKDLHFKGGDGDWYSGYVEKELNVNLKESE